MDEDILAKLKSFSVKEVLQDVRMSFDPYIAIKIVFFNDLSSSTYLQYKSNDLQLLEWVV